jgi:hypothetical protein
MTKEQAMLKQTMSLRHAALAVIAAAALSLPAISSAPAAERTGLGNAMEQCEIIGAISHRCLSFDSDATWPEGLADYHGSNGG